MKKVLALVVIVLVSIAGYIWFTPDDGSALKTDQELLPDYVAQNITRTLYDENGYIADTVKANRLEHFELLGFTQFEQPVYTLYNNQKVSWQANSNHAVWFAEDKIILEQQVNIVSLQPDELIERIKTDTLELIFPANLLQTDRPVFIQGKGFYIEGVGLQADLTKQTLQLVKHNKTVYLNEQ